MEDTMKKREIKVQMIGNYLRPLVEPLKKYGIISGDVGTIIDGCSPLAMEDMPNNEIQFKYLFSKPYDKDIFSVGSIMNLQKNLSVRLSRNTEIYKNCICFDSKNKSNRLKNDSEYIIVYNVSMGSSLFEKNESVYSFIYPLNRFIKDIQSDKDYKCHSFPFSGDFNWRFYYDKFINAIMREYDSDHIILIKLNATQWFLNDFEIAQYDYRASEWRNRIDEIDNYFADKTNCLVIDELYNHIPLSNQPCSFFNAHPSQIDYSALAKSIYKKISLNEQGYCSKGEKMTNPFGRFLFRKLSKDVLELYKSEISLIEDKWLSIYRICSQEWKESSEFFRNISRLKEFLDVDNVKTLSDYIIAVLKEKKSISVNVDLDQIELYTRYMKLNINDIIAVYMLCVEFDEKAKIKKIVENIINNSDCLPIKNALELVDENIIFLNKYPYIHPQLKPNVANSRRFIALGNNIYLVVDPNSEGLIEKVKVEVDNKIDFFEISKNGLSCNILSAESLCTDPEFYIQREIHGLSNQPVVINFEKSEDFIDSLNYIDYSGLLNSERFVISLSSSDFASSCALEYDSIVKLKDTVIVPRENLSSGEQSTLGFVNYFNSLELLFSNLDKQDSANDQDVLLSEKLIYGLRNNNELKKKNQFGKSIKSVIAGYELANKHFSPDAGNHYFLKLSHLGDIVRGTTFISLFREYYTRNCSLQIKKVVVVTTPNYKELMMAYKGVDEVITLTKEELYLLREYSKSEMCIHNIYDDTYKLIKSWGEPNLCSIYKIPETFLFDNPEMIRFPQKMTSISMKNAQVFSEQNKTIPERSVIIMPYAQSSGSIDQNMFKEIIAYYHKIGYTVFSNVGLGEEILVGTIPISEPADVVFSMASMGAIMIGVQSGIMDSLEWFDINIKFIFISMLNAGENIRMFYNKSKLIVSPPPPHDLSHRIERRKGAVSIAIATEQDKLNFSNDVIAQSQIFIKGNIQKQDYCQHEDLKIYLQTNLNSYITEAIKIPHIVILIAVCDSANRYWNSFESRHLLGIKEDLSKSWRLSYLAVIDRDNDVCVEKMTDKWNGVEYSYSFNDVDDHSASIFTEEIMQQYEGMPSENHCWVYSCAMDSHKYTKSSIVINGTDYSINKRGINIVIYSKERAKVIDSISVDTFADPNLSIKRNLKNNSTDNGGLK